MVLTKLRWAVAAEVNGRPVSGSGPTAEEAWAALVAKAEAPQGRRAGAPGGSANASCFGELDEERRGG